MRDNEDNERMLIEAYYKKSGHISLSKECDSFDINGDIDCHPIMIFFLLLDACEKEPAFRDSLFLVADFLSKQCK